MKLFSQPRVAATIVAAILSLVSASALAGDKFRFDPGDTASGRFGKDAQRFCDHNKIKNCHLVRANFDYELPDGITPREAKAARPKVAESPKPAKAKVTKRESTLAERYRAQGLFPWEHVNGAPLRDCGNKTSEQIVEETSTKFVAEGLITETEREELRALTRGLKGPRKPLLEREGRIELVPGMHFAAGTFCRKGEVVVVKNMVAAWDPAKTGPVYAQELVLSTGKTIPWVWNCDNLLIGRPRLPKLPEAPAPAASTPAPAASAPEPSREPERPQPKDDQPRAVIPPVDEDEVVLAKYDWDAGIYVGLDRDVKYAGGEGAFYPVLAHRAWGRYALGIGGMANFWDGSTPSDWDFSGRYGAIGLAQKWSWNERRDLGIKFPMIGTFHERGGRAAFRESRDAKLICASLAYTDASREKAGEKVLPEWQVWLSFCDPTSQSKSRTVFGQPANADGMRDIKYILSAGGRVYLTKDLTGVLGEGGVAAKLQPFVELGVNKTSPNPFSAHLYGGLRGVKKISSIGVGPHYSSAGTVIGATYNHDVGRHVKLYNDEERWAAMVKSLEALGVAIDE